MSITTLMKTIYQIPFLIIFILIALTDGFAQSEKVTAIGLSLNQNIKDAIIEAKNDAKRKAIEKVAGVNIKSSTFITSHQLSSDIVIAETMAEIESYNVIEWKVENLEKQRDKEPYLRTIVNMEVTVKESEIGPDRDFQLQADLNKQIFHDNEEIVIENIQITKPAYLFIVYINGERLIPIVPNNYIKYLRLTPEEIIKFPTDDLKSRGLLLIADTSEGNEYDNEQLLLIATKVNNSIFTNFLLENDSINIEAFSRELMRIPLDSRVVKILDYETHKGK